MRNIADDGRGCYPSVRRGFVLEYGARRAAPGTRTACRRRHSTRLRSEQGAAGNLEDNALNQRIEMMKPVLRAALALLLIFAWTAAVAVEDAKDIVKSTTDQVLERVQSDKAELQDDPGKMYNLVSELIFPHFDFAIMSQWVLGDGWKDATEAQRAAFVEQFRKLLVRTYATALLEFSGQEISYPEIEQKGNANTALVKQVISQPGSSVIPIIYRLHNKNGPWKVFDVSVDGVSLVKTYRASFGAMIKDGGLDSLIASLDSKNEQYGN